MNCMFHEMWGIAWIAKRLLTFLKIGAAAGN
jgi:hypothetical protein